MQSMTLRLNICHKHEDGVVILQSLVKVQAIFNNCILLYFVDNEYEKNTILENCSDFDETLQNDNRNFMFMANVQPQGHRRHFRLKMCFCIVNGFKA